MNTISITLPAINPALHAHNKGRFHSKTRPVKALRQLAAGLVLEQIPRPKVPWQAAVVDYHFVVPDLRRRDAANAIQSQKPAIDGVVDCGLLHDDDWTRLTIGRVTFEVDKQHPRVVLTFHKQDRRFGE